MKKIAAAAAVTAVAATAVGTTVVLASKERQRNAEAIQNSIGDTKNGMYRADGDYVPPDFDSFLRPPGLRGPLLKADAVSYRDFLYNTRLRSTTLNESKFLKIGRDELKRRGYKMYVRNDNYFKMKQNPRQFDDDQLNAMLTKTMASTTGRDQNLMYLKELNAEASRRPSAFYNPFFAAPTVDDDDPTLIKRYRQSPRSLNLDERQQLAQQLGLDVSDLD